MSTAAFGLEIQAHMPLSLSRVLSASLIKQHQGDMTYDYWHHCLSRFFISCFLRLWIALRTGVQQTATSAWEPHLLTKLEDSPDSPYTVRSQLDRSWARLVTCIDANHERCASKNAEVHTLGFYKGLPIKPSCRALVSHLNKSLFTV